MTCALPSYFNHNFDQCQRRIAAVQYKLNFSLPLFEGREKLSLLSLLTYLHIAKGEHKRAAATLGRCHLLSSATLLVLTTETELYTRVGDSKKAKQTLKLLKRCLADTYSEFLEVEALIDLALAHIMFGLNCAALDILHKAENKLNTITKRSGKTACFLSFCYGLVYYYFNKNAERGVSKHYAQLCVDKLTPLLRVNQYRNVCGVYLWKLEMRLTKVSAPVPAGMVVSGYAQYQIGKEFVRAGFPGEGIPLLKQSLDVKKLADTYFWIGEGLVKEANRQKGFDPIWSDILERCPVYVKPPNNEQDTGVSPPPPTAVALYRRDRERRLALTSPNTILKIIQKIDDDRKACSSESLYLEAQEFYKKAIVLSPVLVEKYNLSLARLMIYLNKTMSAEAVLSRVIGKIASPFTLFEASLLLATCFASGKILVAAEHISRCLDLVPRIGVTSDRVTLLTQWCVYYAFYHFNRKNSLDCRYWMDHLQDLGYPEVESLQEKLRTFQEDKVVRMVGAKWGARGRAAAKSQSVDVEQ
ncbi:hypothetical protein ACHWQZ_G017605 [Mnemiopsis leidyi]